MNVKKGRGYKKWKDFKEEIPSPWYDDFILQMKWDNPEIYCKYYNGKDWTKEHRKEYRSYVYESIGFDFKDITAWINNEYNKERSRHRGVPLVEDSKIYRNQYSPPLEEMKLARKLKSELPKYIKTTTV